MKNDKNDRIDYAGNIICSGLSDKTLIWAYLDNAKALAVQKLNFNKQQCIDLQHECNELFWQATGNKTCPAWYISL